MYGTLVNIYTEQWSLYVPHIGQYMYRKVLIIYTTQWSIFVPQID